MDGGSNNRYFLKTQSGPEQLSAPVHERTFVIPNPDDADDQVAVMLDPMVCYYISFSLRFTAAKLLQADILGWLTLIVSLKFISREQSVLFVSRFRLYITSFTLCLLVCVVGRCMLAYYYIIYITQYIII